jgi:tape measure domain-containing protein
MASVRDLALSILITAKNQASGAFNSLRTELNSVNASADRLQTGLNNTLTSVKTLIISAFGIAGITSFISALTGAVKVIQDLRTRLSGLTQSNLDYAASEAYLTDLADRHHKSIQTLTASYASFLALQNSGVITRQQAIQLLEGFSNAATKTGASQEQMAQSTYGLAQALGTGIVAMEEFKQITEPMPGLANEIAKAFGVTVGELRVLIGTGTVASDVFGRKFIEALKAYEGAAERTGGTVSASYADIGNAYTKMARELEKPIAAAVIGTIDVGKSAYGWIKDNGAEIVATLKLIAVTMAGSALSALVSFSSAKLQAAAVERAHSSALIENASRTAAAAQANLTAAAANVALAQSNSVLATSDIQAETATLAVTNATIARTRAEIAALGATQQTTSTNYLLGLATQRLTVAEAARSVSINRLAVLGAQQAVIAARATGAIEAQTAAEAALRSANTALAESQLALNASTTVTGVALTRLASLGKSAFALIGGPVGVAVIALYGLYTVLEKVTGAEEKTAAKAKALADALALSNAEVKKLLTEKEVAIDFSKTEKNIDAVNAKIKTLEAFSFGKLFNAGDISAQRANLLQTLDVLKQRKDALIAQKNETIINFDASALSAAELNMELETTKAKVVEISNRVEPLKKQVENGFLDSNAINADLLSLNAYETKLQTLTAATNTHAQSQDQQTKAFEKVGQAATALTATIDAEDKAQTAAIQKGLADRLAAIDASDVGQLQKDSQRAEAIAQAAQAEIDLAKKTADEKIRIIANVYDMEIQKIGEKNARAAQLEAASIEQRKAIYSELAKHYAAIVDQLGQEHDREVQAARATAESLKQLALQHQFELADIDRQGVDDYIKAESQKYEFEQTLADAETELHKGKAGDQEKINTLLARAHELTRDIGSAEVSLAEDDLQASAARSDSATRLNRLYDDQKIALEQVKKAHEDNADLLAKKQQEAADKLIEVNKELDKIAEKLKQQLLLTINVNDAQVNAAINKINSIPTDKTVTIHTRTVNDGGNGAAEVQKQQAGGPIRRFVQHFAAGGYPIRQGRLPGFGGGDKVPALLEPGEWIIRKEAVAKLGEPAMRSINSGQLPIKRASGGSTIEDNIKNFTGFPGNSGYGSYSTVATIKNYWFRPESIAAAKKRLLELSEKGLQGASDNTTIDPDSLLYAPAFAPVASPAEIRAINARLNALIQAQAASQKSANMPAFNIPAPMPDFLRANSTVAPVPAIVPAQTATPAELRANTTRLHAMSTFNVQAALQNSANRPAFNIPASLPSLPGVAVASAAVSSAITPAQTVTLRFVAPGGVSAAGRFGKADAETMLRVLKEAGAVTQ